MATLLSSAATGGAMARDESRPENAQNVSCDFTELTLRTTTSSRPDRGRQSDRMTLEIERARGQCLQGIPPDHPRRAGRAARGSRIRLARRSGVSWAPKGLGPTDARSATRHRHAAVDRVEQWRAGGARPADAARLPRVAQGGPAPAAGRAARPYAPSDGAGARGLPQVGRPARRPLAEPGTLLRRGLPAHPADPRRPCPPPKRGETRRERTDGVAGRAARRRASGRRARPRCRAVQAGGP